jgi:hypothetical protein
MKPRYPIPGRERQRLADEKSKAKSGEQWYKKAWPWITTTVVLLGWILTNGVTVIQNTAELPDTYVKARSALLARYYDDSAWTGVWSNSPEGYVDSGDVQLSEVDVYLQLETSEGIVNGTIATRKLCTQLPFAIDGVLFKGQVAGNSIKGVAYDFIGSKEVKIASIVIENDSKNTSLLTVQVSDDELHSFPAGARIRRHPDAKPMDTADALPRYCEAVLYPNGRAPVNKARKPVEQLRRSGLH